MKLITSVQIQEFFKGTSRRGQEILPELVRKLIRLSINRNGSVHFPCGDAIYTKGWDGTVQDNTITNEYVPISNSFWEMGTNARTLNKIKADYDKRKILATNYNKREYTYVAVTPKILDSCKKLELEEKCNKEKIFKIVKIIDANDLECWIEYHIDIALWLLSEFNKKFEDIGLSLLVDEWNKILEFAEPQLTYDVIVSGNEAKAHKFCQDISCLQGDNIYSISSPYGKEPAFLFAMASLIQNVDISIQEKVVIAKKQNDLDIINVCCTGKIILIMFNCSDDKIKIGNNNIYVVFNSLYSDDLKLDYISFVDFANALKSMKIPSGITYNVAKMVECNISVLKRLYARNPLARIPKWVRTKDRLELIPLMLMSEIDLEDASSIEILKTIVGSNYDEYIEKLDFWAEMDDAPVLRFENCYTINSRKECFDLMQINIYSIKVGKLEKIIKAILLNEDNDSSIDGMVNEFDHNGMIWHGKVINNILDTFIILSMKNAKFQRHYDYFVQEIFNRCSSDINMLERSSKYFSKLAELSPYAIINYVKGMLYDNNTLFRTLLEDKSKGFYNHIKWALEICLKFEDHAIDALRTVLDLYFSDMKLPNFESLKKFVIQCFSPISTGIIPIAQKLKLNLLFNSINDYYIDKAKLIVKKLVDGGENIISYGVYYSYKLPYRTQSDLLMQDFYDTQKLATSWLISNSEIHEKAELLKNILSTIHTNSLESITEKLAEFKEFLPKDIDDKIKSEINLVALKNIHDIKQFRSNWTHEQAFLPLLEDLYSFTLPKDVYMKYQYIFKLEGFPILDPPDFDSDRDNWYEMDSVKRWDETQNAIQTLISEYGDGIITRIIEDASGKRTYRFWSILYDFSANHDRDFKKFLELKNTEGATVYLQRYDEKKVIDQVKNCDQRHKEFLYSVLPINESLIKYFNGKEDEILYWKNKRFLLQDVPCREQVFEKSLIFNPIVLLDSYAYRNKDFSYEDGIKILKAVVEKSKIEKLFTGSNAHEEYALQEIITNMDKRFYTDELALLEFQLLPFLLNGYIQDYPMGVKNYFWKNPQELGKLLCKLYKERGNFDINSVGAKIYYQGIVNLNKSCLIPREYIVQKKDDLQEWVQRVIEVVDESEVEIKKYIVQSIVSIMALCPEDSVNKIWPTREVAKILEDIDKLKLFERDAVSSSFYFAKINSQGMRCVGNGDYEHNESLKYKQFANEYRAIYPVVSKALDFLSDSFARTGDEDKRNAVRGSYYV